MAHGPAATLQWAIETRTTSVGRPSPPTPPGPRNEASLKPCCDTVDIGDQGREHPGPTGRGLVGGRQRSQEHDQRIHADDSWVELRQATDSRTIRKRRARTGGNPY